MEGDGGAVATTQAAKGIQAIDKTTIHRICSGQVVLTLATGVKELVENSLDAGATSVEVRLRDHGAALLEVVDNGMGVQEHNFEGLTLKHHTSKIQDFADVVGVKTFGFRGEALSSLCALSDLTITTRHSSSEVAAKLTYDHNGKMTSRTMTSRQVGTTVSLQNLFSTLPVRHKEFLRNVKKEFNKMVQVLYAYCLISTGIRITCTNQNEKGRKVVVVATSGQPTVRENLYSIFGAKQASTLLDFEQEAASQEVLEEFGISLPAAAVLGGAKFCLEGVVSTCSHGQGRSASDRQFYFINSRPCDPSKVMKLVNEVYHQYNRHQYPCVVLNIRLQNDNVDVNVTPDKRQIFVNHEKMLLATVKASLKHLYEHIPSTYTMHNTSLTPTHNTPTTPTHTPTHTPTQTPTQTPTSTRKFSALSQRFGRLSSASPQPPTPPGGLCGLKRPLPLGTASSPSPDRKQPKLMSFLKPIPEAVSEQREDTEDTEDTELGMAGVCPLPLSGEEGTPEDTHRDTEGDNQQIKSNGSDSKVPDASRNNIKEENDASSTISQATNGDLDPIDMKGDTCDSNAATNGDSEPGDASNKTVLTCNGTPGQSEGDLTNRGHSDHSAPSSTLHTSGTGMKVTPHRLNVPTSSSSSKIHNATSDLLNSFKARLSSVSSGRNSNTQKKLTERRGIADVKISASLTEQEDEVEVVFEGETNTQNSDAGSDGTHDERVASPNGDGEASYKVVMLDDDERKEETKQRKCKVVPFDINSLRRKLSKARRRKEERGDGIVRRFRARISPTDNGAAEDELRKEISKDMFTKMEVLGQFNLGFIIARLGHDLFIIDQHATDEKYNFETLQQSHVLQNQRLIAPQTLELTAIGEATLLDNLEIFRKNGYEFLVREEEPPGRRVSLLTMPVSRGWEFGRSDVEELIFMLSDAPGTMCRPSRIRAMFASRACRKSVMIGTALSQRQMRELVAHMGEMDHPWNCPHGRPTMRHLVNLDMVAPGKS